MASFDEGLDFVSSASSRIVFWRPVRWNDAVRKLQLETSIPKRQTKMPARTASLFFFCLASIVVTGCGNGGLATLTGTVTIDGELAPAGVGLEFNPLQGGSSSYAETDEKGAYVAAYTHKRLGIEPGEHRVKLFPAGSGGGREKMPTPGEKVAGGMRGSPSGP